MFETKGNSFDVIWTFDPDLPSYKEKLVDKDYLSNLALFPSQTWCLIDLYDEEVVPANNFNDLFGWEPKSMTDCFKKLHKDDQKLVDGQFPFEYSMFVKNKQPFKKIISKEIKIKVHDAVRNVLQQSCVYSNDKKGNIVHILNIFIILIPSTVSDPITQYSNSQSSVFTERQLEILSMLAKGYKANDIAKELELSVHTIYVHCKRMKLKVGASNLNELIHKAKKNYWL